MIPAFFLNLFALSYFQISTEDSVLARSFYLTDRAIVLDECGRACSLFGISYEDF